MFVLELYIFDPVFRADSKTDPYDCRNYYTVRWGLDGVCKETAANCCEYGLPKGWVLEGIRLKFGRSNCAKYSARRSEPQKIFQAEAVP